MNLHHKVMTVVAAVAVLAAFVAAYGPLYRWVESSGLYPPAVVWVWPLVIYLAIVAFVLIAIAHRLLRKLGNQHPDRKDPK